MFAAVFFFCHANESLQIWKRATIEWRASEGLYYTKTSFLNLQVKCSSWKGDFVATISVCTSGVITAKQPTTRKWFIQPHELTHTA